MLALRGMLRTLRFDMVVWTPESKAPLRVKNNGMFASLHRLRTTAES